MPDTHVERQGLMATRFDPRYVPDDLQGKLVADDMIQSIDDLPSTALTVCAIGFSAKQLLASSSIVAWGKALTQGELGCTSVTADQRVVVVDVPPVRKLP